MSQTVREIRRDATLLPTTLLAIILVATPLLKMPMSQPEGGSIYWIEALFTATSAATLTGLTVVDTATRFSPIGKAVIGIVIQLGALTMLTLGAFAGQRLCFPQSQSALSLGAIFRRVAAWTIGVEAIAALIMMPLWQGDLTLMQRCAMSVFHAVSAFGNAGFSLQSDSLADYRYSLLSHAVIAPLIVVGSLGWPVMSNIAQSLRGRARLAPHSRLVMGVAACAYLAGTLTIAAMQLAPRTYDYFKLGNEPNKTVFKETTASTVGTALADASFISLAGRTSGMTTLPPNELTPASNAALIALMAVGGAPGSAAGGLKSVVVALIAMNLLASIRGKTSVKLFGIEISDSNIRKASAVATAFGAMVVCVTIILCASEAAPFIKIVFEVVSAASNSGLSLGITSALTGIGKASIILCMFVGRAGPLMFAAMMTSQQETHDELDDAFPDESR